MQKFVAKAFDIGKLEGISIKNIEEHLKLYTGYIKNTNLVLEHMENLMKDGEKYAYELSELQRRFSFEFCGMRNHEYYFSSLEGGAKILPKNSEFKKAIEKDFYSFDGWLNRFKATALTRGVGWTILYMDKQTGQLLNQWVDEHHLGQLASTSPILCLDMWEHAFVTDYQPSGKKQYIEDFFANLNWENIEKNFLSL